MKYFLILLILSGCYTSQKAKKDFSRAVTFDPAIGVDFCARNYGCDTIQKDSIIYISDSAAFTDALQMVTEENARMNAIVDSLLSIEPPDSNDARCYRIIEKLRKQNEVLAYKLAHIPAIRDTIRLPGAVVIDRAALEACQIDKTRLIASIGPTEALRDKYKKRARTYLWILIACGALLGASAYSKIAGIFKPKV